MFLITIINIILLGVSLTISSVLLRERIGYKSYIVSVLFHLIVYFLPSPSFYLSILVEISLLILLLRAICVRDIKTSIGIGILGFVIFKILNYILPLGAFFYNLLSSL